MNLTDLQAELCREADDIPDLQVLQLQVARTVTARVQNRRRTALVAVAAAVVVLIGGGSFFVKALSHSNSPVATAPVAPSVPIPAGSALIRHALPAVISPVTATHLPANLRDQVWFNTPGRLAVAWFATADPTPGRSAGYVITDTADGDGQITDDGTTGRLTTTAATSNGRPLTVETGPAGSADEFGFPTHRRLAWPLNSGRWIHVFATDSSELEAIAAGIRETPNTLPPTIGLDITLPGLTVPSTANTALVAPRSVNEIAWCPIGVQPFAVAHSSSSGSSTGPTITTDTGDPAARCIVAILTSAPGTNSAPSTAVEVAGKTVHVDQQDHLAWTDGPDHTLAIVRVPAAAKLSDLELATLAAAVTR